MDNIEINKLPKPKVNLLYNGKDCTADFSKYLQSITFTENEEEESDELSLNISDYDGYFSDLWYPRKGDKLTCDIIYGNDIFKCGTFTIDDNNFDFTTTGDYVDIKAIATSTNFSVRTKKAINHSGKTLTQIANKIGKSYGFKVLGTTGNIKIGTIVQKNESDITFLRRVSLQYGYIFNIKDNYLTFIKSEELGNAKSLFSLSKSDCSLIHLNDTATKIYGKCKVQYLDLKTNTLKNYIANGNTEITDILTIHKRCDSIEEAKHVAEAALKNSHREISGNITLGKPINNFIAGVNFELNGVGRFEGKYHIKSTQRKVDNSGYKVEGEIIKC
jgi:uncharacterized protein